MAFILRTLPLAALLGLGELGTGDDNPCLTLAADRSEADRGEGQGGNAAQRLLDGAGRALKGLFGE